MFPKAVNIKSEGCAQRCGRICASEGFWFIWFSRRCVSEAAPGLCSMNFLLAPVFRIAKLILEFWRPPSCYTQVKGHTNLPVCVHSVASAMHSETPDRYERLTSVSSSVDFDQRDNVSLWLVIILHLLWSLMAWALSADKGSKFKPARTHTCTSSSSSSPLMSNQIKPQKVEDL